MNAIFRTLLVFACSFSVSPVFPQSLQNPSFDFQRGFYDAAFYLNISQSGTEAQVVFTTDGSMPSIQNGTIYRDSLLIDESTVIRAAYFEGDSMVSSVETHSYIFIEDILKQKASIPGWPNTQYPTDYRGNTAVHDYEMDPQIVQDSVYAADIRKGLIEIPTVSLSTSLEEFWRMNDRWHEVPVSVEVLYFEKPSKNHQADAGIEGMSHRHQKRSYRLEFKEKYGPKKFKTDILKKHAPLNRDNIAESFDQLILRAGTQRSWARNWIPNGAAFIRDQWYRDSQIEMNSISSHGTFVHLYVNGVYFGMYNLIERPNAKFMEDYYGGQDSDYFVFNHNGYISGDSSRFEKLIYEILDSDLSHGANYAKMKAMIDLPQFHDYLLLTWYAGMVDWPNNNYYGSMSQEYPLRMFAWDCEQSWDYAFGAFPGGWVPHAFRKDKQDGPVLAKIFNRAKINPDFLIEFADRVYKQCFNGGPLEDENSRARWSALAAYISNAVVAESARWGDGLNDGTTRTRNEHWYQSVLAVDDVMQGNVDQFVQALQAEGYFPGIMPPTWTHSSELLDIGSAVSMQNPNSSGNIYYRTDGGDPRNSGGTISDKAILYEGEVSLERSVLIKARVFNGTEWSALNASQFLVKSVFSDLFINEFQASGDGSDWIEIYNAGKEEIQLGGLYITDNLSKQQKWQLPVSDQLIIASKGHILLFADKMAHLGPLHLDFKLDAKGEEIGLYRADYSGIFVVDSIKFGEQEKNVSFGRKGDGGHQWIRQSISTPNGPNHITPSPQEEEPVKRLVINEVLSFNLSNLTDASGEFADWIEIFNPDTVAHDLAGLYLTDDLSQPFFWQISDQDSVETIIKPGGFKLIWLDDDPEEGLLHAPFKLKSGGEFIGLSQRIGDEIVWLDSLEYQNQIADVTIGRFPDGSDSIYELTYPSPGASNVYVEREFDCRGRWPALYKEDACGQCLLPDDPTFNACLINKSALFIANNSLLGQGDLAIQGLLEEMGYTVEAKTAAFTDLQDTEGKSLILISSSANAKHIPDFLKTLDLPIITWNPSAYAVLGMVDDKTDKATSSSQKGNETVIRKPSHPIAKNLPRNFSVYQRSGKLHWGKPIPTADVIASLPSASEKALLFAFEEGIRMNGFETSARRLGAFLHEDEVSVLSEDGKSLLRAAICWTGKCAEVPDPIIEAPAINPGAPNPGIAPFLFPNPSSRHVTISMPHIEVSDIKITVLNALGQVKMQKQQKWSSEVQLKTGDLPPGTYFINIRSGRHSWYQRMIKK